ncbi:hypothetical protein R1sor_015667 [Riccia sorocarpa]|uniref:Reverse transcriptase domain-containing protein n=1 Tax=Riccia sorocarpa TaxID=122646 RepID=A0ABD3HCW1_9MARC
MLPHIIDTQQIGFVSGRNIVDNALSLRLAQEWAQVTQQDTLFIKLDFQKAYDRVSHTYLWETLSALGLEEDNLYRIRGVVTKGFACIHFNGRFTEYFPVERGFRQGCPLAPFLFAMSTQSPMRLLRQEEAAGRLRGLGIGEGKSLLHQLYADDTGICVTAEQQQFNHLQSIIQDFEAKTLLLKHVLAATPLYQLLTVGLANEGLTALEQLCRQFLWGWQEDRRPRTALVAWNRVAQHKNDGGLGWLPFLERAKAANIKCIVKLLNGSEAEWAILTRSLILRTLRNGSYQRERRQCTAEEAITFLPLQKIQDSPTLSRMLKSWQEIKKKLKWDLEGVTLPRRSTIGQINMILEDEEQEPHGPIGRLIATLNRAEISNVAEGIAIWSAGSTWLSTLQAEGIFLEETDNARLQEIENWIKEQQWSTEAEPLHNSWRWRDSRERFQNNHTIKVWTSKLARQQDFNDLLNDRWHLRDGGVNWSWRWVKLWQAHITYRRKTWLWKLLQRGLFTWSRAKEMGVAEGVCCRCHQAVESIEHLFWTCRKNQRCKWEMWKAGILHTPTDPLMTVVDTAFRDGTSNPSRLAALGLITKTIWRERNEKMFRNKNIRIPLRNLMKTLQLEVEACLNPKDGDNKYRALMTAGVGTELEAYLKLDRKHRQPLTRYRVDGRRLLYTAHEHSSCLHSHG